MVTIPPIDLQLSKKQVHRPAHHLRQSWKEIPDRNTKIVIFVYILSHHQLQTNTEMIILRSQPSFLVIILLVTTLHTPQATCGFNNTQLSSLPRIFSILQISAASKNAVIHPQRLRTIRQPHERYLNTFVKRPQNKISGKITDTLLSTRNTTIRQKTDTPIANPGYVTQRLLRGTGAVAHKQQIDEASKFEIVHLLLPNNERLVSWHVHDYKSIEEGDKYYMIDGGQDSLYVRCSYPADGTIVFRESLSTAINWVRSSFKWTSILDKQGVKLTKPITRLLKDLDTDHILQLIQLRDESYLKHIFIMELQHRKECI